ncbi:septum formation initiator family protein [candidate division WOR-3 bacterium]|nr:septum formation initiator family protein [candidate division WOR-3 bacterium]
MKYSKKLIKKNLKKILFILILSGIIYYLFFGAYGFINIIKLKRSENKLKNEKQELLKEEAALLDSLKKIKRDTFLIEKIAREELGMIKDGDTVIIYDEK